MPKVKQAWLVVIGGFIFFMFQLGTQKTLGVFITFIAHDLGLSEHYVRTSCGIGVGIRLILAPLWAMIAKSVSPRKVTFFGGLLTCLGFVWGGFVNSMTELTLSLAVSGIGLGLPYVSVPQIICDHFVNGESHDTAIGLIFVGSAIGMTVFPPIAETLIDAYGWRSALMLLGAACLNISVGACFFKPVAKIHNARVDNHSNKMVKKFQSSRLKIPQTLLDRVGIAAIINKPIFLMYLLAFFLWGLTYSGWTLFSFSYALSLEFTPRAASMFSAICGIGTLFGRCISILQKQWTSQYLQLVLLSAGSGLSLVCYPFAKTYLTLTIVSFLAGVFIGTPPPVCVLITKDMTNDIPESYSGALGLQYMFQGFGMLVGGPLTGYIFDLLGSFDVAFYSLAFCEFVAALISVVNQNSEINKCSEIKELF